MDRFNTALAEGPRDRRSALVEINLVNLIFTDRFSGRVIHVSQLCACLCVRTIPFNRVT